jgi:hypothetical protein
MGQKIILLSMILPDFFQSASVVEADPMKTIGRTKFRTAPQVPGTGLEPVPNACICGI